LYLSPNFFFLIKPVFKEKGTKLPIQKNSHPTCFFFHPQIVHAKFSQEQQKKSGENNNGS
jgi:hypothetical protein